MTGKTSLYLYGITNAEADTLRPALDGVAGATSGAPEPLPCGAATVIVGAHDGAELMQTRRRMLAHTRVLERAMEASTVLPMRFGVVADDAAAVRMLVETHQEEIAAQISRLDGHAEIGLRVRVSREGALDALLAAHPDLAATRDRLAGRGPEAHFERIDLGRRVAETLERRRTDAQRRLAGLLDRLCTDHVLRAPEEDTEILRAECLLPSGGETAFAAEIEAAAAAIDFAGAEEPVVQLVGPAPPFHFVSLALQPAGPTASEAV